MNCTVNLKTNVMHLTKTWTSSYTKCITPVTEEWKHYSTNEPQPDHKPCPICFPEYTREYIKQRGIEEE